MVDGDNVAQEMLEHESRNRVNHTFENVVLVLPTGQLNGQLQITTTKFVHTPYDETQEGKANTKDCRTRERQLSQVTYIQRRRYLLRDSAIELFFSNAQRPMFLNCGDATLRKALAQALEMSAVSLKTSGYRVRPPVREMSG